MSVYIVYWSCDESGRVRLGAYLSLEEARSAVCNHSDNRCEVYPKCYFYEEYELGVCEPDDGEVKRQKLFHSSSQED
jgi:hypothetical protein